MHQTSLFNRPTKADKLIAILVDGHWHSTKELARRVGHTFAVAIFVLRRTGHTIDRRRHPHGRNQHQYRLVSGPTR